jgi:predicted TIM-barrel fold metal-dependent hydrolase
MTEGSVQIIDADGHVNEHERIFQEYLEPELRDRRPEIVTMPTGARFWLIEGKLIPRPFGARGPGVPTGFHPAGDGMKVTHARDGSLDDLEGRLRDLDEEGIAVQVLYPNTTLVAPFLNDTGLAAGLCRAYNNYVAERCAMASSRLKWLSAVPLQDPPQAIRELDRAVELGAVGAVIPGMVGDRPLDRPEFFPFFEAADRLGVALGVHAVTGAYDTVGQEAFDKFLYAHIVAMPFALMIGMMTIIGGGILERLHRVRVAFLETGAGWVPYWSWWMDEHFEKGFHLGRSGTAARADSVRKYFPRDDLPHFRTLPSEILFRSGRCFFACEADEDLAYIASVVGEDNLITGSDYPHGDLTPGALREFMGRKDLSEDLKRKVLQDNPSRLYGIETRA